MCGAILSAILHSGPFRRVSELLLAEFWEPEGMLLSEPFPATDPW